ncbi:helix-turn-helix domain-containing protein [Comamonadaceae bacterium OH2545_COT-014]|nr:helix-turn-helix domain-containing protein [Comamonadaceae bacterium OH2545_COT-014]
MDSTLFNELVTSLKEAGQIARGEIPASRRFKVDALDVKHVRERTGLSQSEFAGLMRVSVKTLQNWEQRRRAPTGPASALLTIVARNPVAAMNALHG